MAAKKSQPSRDTFTRELAVHPDSGQPVYNVVETAKNKAVLITGPVQGSVTLADGRVVDVTHDVIAVDDVETAHEVAHRIGLKLELEGHPLHRPGEDEPFVHLCTPGHCGEHKRDDAHPLQALALTRAAQQGDGVIDPGHKHRHGYAMGLHDDDGPGPATMTRAGVAAENAALNGLDGTGSTNVIPDVSLHTGDPGTTGANENANSGSYARQACSWNAAASGAKTNSSTLTFTTGGSTAVTYFGTWSSATYGAGNYAIGGALASSVTAVTIVIAAGAISIGAT